MNMQSIHHDERKQPTTKRSKQSSSSSSSFDVSNISDPKCPKCPSCEYRFNRRRGNKHRHKDGGYLICQSCYNNIRYHKPIQKYQPYIHRNIKWNSSDENLIKDIQVLNITDRIKHTTLDTDIQSSSTTTTPTTTLSSPPNIVHLPQSSILPPISVDHTSISPSHSASHQSLLLPQLVQSSRPSRKRKFASDDENLDVTCNATRPLILVLGMAHVSDAYIQSSHVRSDTTSAPHRDKVRLDALEEYLELKFDTISMNKWQTKEDCLPHKHYQGAFSSRTASSLIEEFGDDLKFDRIYLDYFRFPQGYIEKVYTSFVHGGMLTKLITEGLLSESCEIIIPNYEELKTQLKENFQQKVIQSTRRNKINNDDHVYLRYEPCQPSSYPLYAVTDYLWEKKDQDTETANIFGGYIHKEEIKQLNQVLIANARIHQRKLI
jgi:hypothetical protein